MILHEVQRMERVRALIADPHTPEFEVAQRAYVQLAQCVAVPMSRSLRLAVVPICSSPTYPVVPAWSTQLCLCAVCGRACVEAVCQMPRVIRGSLELLHFVTKVVRDLGLGMAEATGVLDMARQVIMKRMLMLIQLLQISQ
eukprot:206236-Pelagomonas_calceolata.AAC.1